MHRVVAAFPHNLFQPPDVSHRPLHPAAGDENLPAHFFRLQANPLRRGLGADEIHLHPLIVMGGVFHADGGNALVTHGSGNHAQHLYGHTSSSTGQVSQSRSRTLPHTGSFQMNPWFRAGSSVTTNRPQSTTVS